MKRQLQRIDLCANIIQTFLSEESSQQILTLEEELDLAHRICEGDEEALHKLVVANTQFVITVAKKYTYSGIPLEDLIAEGMLGLFKAAKKYDPGYRVKFITYAVWWIRCAILESISRNAWVTRLPASRIRILTKVRRDLQALEQRLGRKVTEEELSEYSKIERGELELLNSISSSSRSLEMPVREGDTVMLSELLPDDSFASSQSELIRNDILDLIREAFSNLNDRQSDIIHLYYGLDGAPRLTLEEIGMKYGISRERVRQLREQALKKMHSILKNVHAEMSN